jgi:hypothetical protein
MMGSLDELDVVDLPVTILVNAVERSRDPSAELIIVLWSRRPFSTRALDCHRLLWSASSSAVDMTYVFREWVSSGLGHFCDGAADLRVGLG